MSYRTVTDTIPLYPNSPVSFFLRNGSFDLLETHPPVRVDTETDDNGGLDVELWANGDGFVRSEWLALYPGKEAITFVLPAGASPITMAELREQEEDADWFTPPDTATIDLERARYADTGSVGLGDALIGTRNTGAGAVGTTVHAKLGHLFFLTDYDSFAEAVTAAAGETLVINAATAPAANTTVPSTVSLEFTRAGRINPATGITVTINGPMSAGRWTIFGGLGSIAGTPRIDAAYPEWFGAAGVDTTGNVDALAYHKALAFFPVVQGDGQTHHIINTMRMEYHDKDMHDIGHGYTDPQFDGGYYCGFSTARDGARLLDCIVEMTGEVQVAENLKARHCVGFGEVNGSRTSDIAMERCTFYLHANMQTSTGVALLGGRPRAWVACSVDGLKLIDNRIIGPAIDVAPRPNNILGGYNFDCTDMTIERNYHKNAFFFAEFEYCNGIHTAGNHAYQSWQFYDFDKICTQITIVGETFTRTEYLTTGSDQVFEFNSCEDVTVLGCTVSYPRGYAVVNGKDLMYPTWAEALANADLNDRIFVAWKRHTFRGNKIRNSLIQGVVVGNTWETDDGSPRHAGVLPGDDLTVEDEFWNCGEGLGSDAAHGIFQISEGTRIVIASKVDGTPARYTTLAADVLEGATSITLTDAASFPVDSFFSVILNTDTDHSKTHHVPFITAKVGNVLTVSPAFPVTDPDTGDPPLVPVASAGALVRIGSMGGHIVSGRSWVTDDTYTITNPDGSTTLHTVTDADLWSDLDITVRDSFFRGAAWNAINLSRMSSLTLENFRAVDCGFHQANPQQVLIIQPEAREARIHMSDVNIYTKDLVIPIGLQFNSKDFRSTGAWKVYLRAVHVEGHADDFYLRDNNTGVFTPTESLENFSIDATCVMPNTNINSVTALGWRARSVMFASGPPTGVDARDAWPVVGDVIIKYPPISGQPYGWECTDASAKPGVWKAFGTLA